MLVLVTGGSGSGKSAYAEEKILSFGQGKRIYIATMFPFDKEETMFCSDSYQCKMKEIKGRQCLNRIVLPDTIDYW